MNFSTLIDQTLLKPETTSEQIRKLCQDALECQFFGVCINSSWVPLASSLLKGSSVKTVSVIGFPLGAMSSQAKSFEAEWCVRQGAQEIDMVIALGAVKEKNWDFVRNDIREVVKGANGALVKVILETGLLNLEEKKTACQITVEAGAHFVKTCTGFNIGSATVEDVALMRAEVGPRFGVKASGGIKTAAQAIALVEAGATRLGTSSGVALVQGQSVTGGY